MADDKLKYLEFLQLTIARMATNSFVIKGWSVALGAAVLGFSVKDGNWRLALIATGPAACFCLLDAYYLGLEKLFRGLWDRAVAGQEATFNMNPGVLTAGAFWAAVRRPTVCLVHVPVIVAAILVALTLGLLRSTGAAAITH